MTRAARRWLIVLAILWPLLVWALSRLPGAW